MQMQLMAPVHLPEPIEQVLFCDPHQVVFEKREDGRFLNVRGKVKDTSCLQSSIVEANNRILNPVQLKLVDGQLICVDGHRRTIAARKLDIPLPYLLININDGLDSIDHMLVSNVRQNFPPLVLDSDGTIVGGLAHAVAQKVAQGKTPLQIARLMGYKTDRTVKRLIALFKADAKVLRAVASGRMSLKAFDAIRTLTAEKQTAVLETIEETVAPDEEMTYTKDSLRRASKKQSTNTQHTLTVPDEPSVVQQLNQLKHQLQTLLLTQPVLGPREQEILNEIKEIVHV